MHHLYISVALPKMTYRLDIWYTPPFKEIGKKEKCQVSTKGTKGVYQTAKDCHVSLNWGPMHFSH